jgi:hypothetical protein
MSEYWGVKPEYLTLPTRESECNERRTAALKLLSLLHHRKDSAPQFNEQTGFNERTGWTKWIMGNLSRLENREEFYSYARNYANVCEERTAHEGEYMTIDFCWAEGKTPNRIVLAVESELDDSKKREREIQKDFEKLLAVKSPYKLLVYSSTRENKKLDDVQKLTHGDIVGALEESLKNYGHHLLGETYIFVDYVGNSGDHGNFEARMWQPSANGEQKNTKLETIKESEYASL